LGTKCEVYRLFSTGTSTKNGAGEPTLQTQLREERQEIIHEAKALTLALYRTCVRSARVIRHGNDHDEKEFQDRERDRLEGGGKRGGQMSMISMMPPVDREDELRSRAEYYMQYARENFVQESDSLGHDDWNEQHVSRYLYHLRRGDDHRKWLLKDMKFDDPYKSSVDNGRVDRFEKRALDYVSQILELKQLDLSPKLREYVRNQRADKSVDDDPEDDDGFWSGDDDDERTLPEWYKNRKSGGAT
jgi:hypothetical protein